MDKRVNDSRRILVRQLILKGEIRNLQLVAFYGKDRYLITPFQCETAATVFVDTPLALLNADRVDNLFFDILNSIESFDELITFLRESEMFVSADFSSAVLAEIVPRRCRLFKM